jgi:hypothetical protein
MWKALQDWINKNLDLNEVSGGPGSRLWGLRIRVHCVRGEARRITALVA